MNRTHKLFTALALAIVFAAPQAQARTALQKHVDFFDRDLDGDIEWYETYEGCRALGIGTVTSGSFATAINAALGFSTGGSLFTVMTATIHQGMHGSDTGIYDSNGNYVQEAFNALFNNYDHNRDDLLDEDEFDALYAGQYTDAGGSAASRAEFEVLIDVAGETRTQSKTWSACSYWWCPSYSYTESYDVLTRKTMESFYDGSLFYVIAGEPVPND